MPHVSHHLNALSSDLHQFRLRHKRPPLLIGGGPPNRCAQNVQKPTYSRIGGRLRRKLIFPKNRRSHQWLRRAQQGGTRRTVKCTHHIAQLAPMVAKSRPLTARRAQHEGLRHTRQPMVTQKSNTPHRGHMSRKSYHHGSNA